MKSPFSPPPRPLLADISLPRRETALLLPCFAGQTPGRRVDAAPAAESAPPSSPVVVLPPTNLLHPGTEGQERSCDEERYRNFYCTYRMEGEKGTVCVTGAGGYIASWLVKLLLSNGYKVNGTVRDPCDERNSHLKKLDKAAENLKLFKADLLDYDSLLPAISGCDGVFHTASPVPPSKVANPEVELYAPAVTGTQNVLKACSEFKVRRVVVVSSTASVVMNPDWSVDKKMDESCWSDKEYCKTTENFYCLSKTMAEEEAFKYSNEAGLDVVTVLPCYVIGPMLQPTINASSLAFINMIKGVRETMEDTVHSLVDVRDVADALLMTYEKPEANRRYICACCSVKTSDFIAKLKSFFPNYKYPKSFSDPTTTLGVVSSEKLKGLGWKCRDMGESIIDSVKFYEEAGFLNES